MIIKRIQDLGNISTVTDFIREHKSDKIIIYNRKENDFSIMDKIIKICNTVDTFLSIEIGSDFFLIRRVTSKSVNGCPYQLTDKSMDAIIKENL